MSLSITKLLLLLLLDNAPGVSSYSAVHYSDSREKVDVATCGPYKGHVRRLLSPANSPYHPS